MAHFSDIFESANCFLKKYSMNFKVLIGYSLPQIPMSQWKLAPCIGK